MQVVGKKLHEKGVTGVVDEDENVMPSALLRFFIDREVGILNISEEEMAHFKNLDDASEIEKND